MKTEKEIRKRFNSVKRVFNPKSFCDGCGSKNECEIEARLLKWVLGEK
jgi:rRNA maturation endonuclease Nob1